MIQKTSIILILIFASQMAQADSADIKKIVSNLDEIQKGPGIEVKCADTEKANSEDPNAEFLVYTDLSGIKYYEFYSKPFDRFKAAEHCKEKGLRLPFEGEMVLLDKELKADKMKREKWLGEESSEFRASSVINGKFYNPIIWNARVNGEWVFSYDYRAGAGYVRCVDGPDGDWPKNVKLWWK
jgi:hypothetical protein